MPTKQETSKAQTLADLMRSYLAGARVREPWTAYQVTLSYTFSEQLRFMELQGDGTKKLAVVRNRYNWSNQVLWTVSVTEAGYLKSRLEKLDPLAVKLFLIQMGYLLNEYASMMECAQGTSEWDGDEGRMQLRIKSYSSRVSKIVITISATKLVAYPKTEGA